MGDGLGWVADDVAKVFEPMLAQGGPGAPPFELVRNANWMGLQLSVEAAGFGREEKEILNIFGGQGPLLAHHRPSGKLILATGKGFAEKLFAPKPSLSADPTFQKTMQGLPQKGTGLSYFSPTTFRILREVFEKANDLEHPKEFGGHKIQPLEGVSLRPAFHGKKLGRKDALYFDHHLNGAIRDGQWKLVRYGETGREPKLRAWELYDMDQDRSETNNLAKDHPDKVKKLADKWEKWAVRARVKPWPWKVD